MYLVHYTGWNTRYDEWVKRVRIAENLTWTPTRKRSKSAHGASPGAVGSGASTLANLTKSCPAKRGRTRGQDSSRSATPSSVTSTSSTGQRNASQTPAGDDSNPATGSTNAGLHRRRSRRVSERSAGASSSDGDREQELEQNVKTLEQRKSPECEERTPRRRRRRKLIDRKESEGEESVKQPESPAPAEGAPTAAVAPRRGRRRIVETEEAIVESMVTSSADVAADSGGATADEAQKGQDFDLKKIRSQLKMPVGIISESGSVAAPPPAAPVVVSPVATPVIVVAAGATCSPATGAAVTSPTPRPPGGGVERVAKGNSDDDVYEFREPEPFEFEVRARRESPFSEERVGRFVRKNRDDDEESPSPKKPWVCFFYNDPHFFDSFSDRDFFPCVVQNPADKSPATSPPAAAKARPVNAAEAAEDCPSPAQAAGEMTCSVIVAPPSSANPCRSPSPAVTSTTTAPPVTVAAPTVVAAAAVCVNSVSPCSSSPSPSFCPSSYSSASSSASLSSSSAANGDGEEQAAPVVSAPLKVVAAAPAVFVAAAAAPSPSPDAAPVAAVVSVAVRDEGGVAPQDESKLKSPVKRCVLCLRLINLNSWFNLFCW